MKNLSKEVEPFKNMKDIIKIKQYLLGKANKRDYLLFTLGINIGLRASDLLNLKIKDVLEKDSIELREQKTKKIAKPKLCDSAKEAINLYINSLDKFDLDDYLFQSRKGKNSKITIQRAHQIIDGVAKELNIKGNYGTHSLRKTFAYQIYSNHIKNNPSILETLQKILNHSSPAITLRYIGITREVIDDIYANLNL